MEHPPRPNDIASQTKRRYIPTIIDKYSKRWPQYSTTYRASDYASDQRLVPSAPQPPTFIVEANDPVSSVVYHSHVQDQPFAYLCGAHAKKPGGDWDTGVLGSEEELCRRSSLSASLAAVARFYPLPGDGAIFSPNVVVFRGPADRYALLPERDWFAVPVVSAAPVRLPKLNTTDPAAAAPHGPGCGAPIRYSFAEERAQSRQIMKAALKAVLACGFTSVVIADFGLGRAGRNPPRVMADMWRELFLYDPEIRGRFVRVVFAFPDARMCTEDLIYEAAARAAHKEASKGSHRRGAHANVSGGAAVGPPPQPPRYGHRSETEACYSTPVGADQYSGAGAGYLPGLEWLTDYEIFRNTFHVAEIQRVLGTRDPRYGLEMLTS
ncbi:hypothetical protein BROUX41_002596 [Berkeleyomyces rouxiae]|uniref:uncharacterized protein n=1 Tax=Berkeleyomyces rouxiae TaxID=2035830 RepID=UPI003B793091